MNDEARKSIADLLAVMAALRTPGTGCPWDLEQTFKTIAPYTIEEAYEVADAIERGDMADLKDELGDLLLQVVYHARMAEEQHAFAFADVAEAITAKMIRRHPHVFGSDGRARGRRGARVLGAHQGGGTSAPNAVSKQGARQRALPSSCSGEPSVLDGVPAALPALTRAVKLQNKAAKVGFDWPSLGAGIRQAEGRAGGAGRRARRRREALAGRAKIEEEFGDLLFVVANVARHLKLDPEAALRAANQKFTRRFHAIERKLAEDGRTPAQSTLAEMDRLWDEAKAGEKGR